MRQDNTEYMDKKSLKEQRRQEKKDLKEQKRKEKAEDKSMKRGRPVEASGKNFASKLNDSLKNLSYKNLSASIKGYGYDYSFSKYMVGVIVTLIAIVGAGYLYSLHLVYTLIVATAAIIALPIIIVAQFSYISNNDRFEQIVNYLDQMILSFKRNPKILEALENTVPLVEGDMKKCVMQAIKIIKTDAKSKNVYAKAFLVIEKEFKCSRLRTLHRFLMNVESENSTAYHKGLDNLYFDVRSWVTRTYQYQADLADTKKKIVIVMGLSLGIAAFFSYVLQSSQEKMSVNYNFNVIDNPVYQIATVIFLLLFIIIFCFLNTKVNGYWLVNDISNIDEKVIDRYLNEVKNYSGIIDNIKQPIIAASFGAVLAIVGIIIHKKFIVLLGIVVAVFLLLKRKLSYNKKKKTIERELLKEFPIWMRDVAILLNNMVVVRAVRSSLRTAAPILKPFIRDFLKEEEKDPVSIKPYLNFLGNYNVSELSTAVKTLYSIRILSAEDSQRQINDLVKRNQELLANAEQLRHQDSIGSVTMISMLPMVILSFKLIIDMGVMLLQFMSMTSM